MHILGFTFSSVQFSSVAQSCPTLCDPTPGLPVRHQLPEFTQTYVHRVGDAIQSFIIISADVVSKIPWCLKGILTAWALKICPLAFPSSSRTLATKFSGTDCSSPCPQWMR